MQTTGIKTAVTVPSGATLEADIESSQINAGGGRRTTTSGAAMDITAANMSSDDNVVIHISIWVLNGSTAGTVQVQFAQSTSSATNLTIRKGSHITPSKIA
jgi:hypothetical protein